MTATERATHVSPRPGPTAESAEVAAGVYRFDTGPFNWYVVAEQGRLTLVDAGFPAHFRVFRRGIEALGYTVRDVAGVVVTHAHADHLGFAERVAREAGAPVFVHPSDVSAAQRPLQLPWFGLLSRAWRPAVARMLLQATREGVFRPVSVAKPVGMIDGQELDLPGRPVVIHAPGHTAGQVALHLAARQTLLSSDVLVTRDLYRGADITPAVPPQPLNDDHASAFRSLDRVAGLGRVTLLPGHGRPWTGEMGDAVRLARGE